MKNTTRFILGLLASLFLNIGFARAAEVCSASDAALVAQSGATDEQSNLPSSGCTYPSSW